jgi:hypothetical protein
MDNTLRDLREFISYRVKEGFESEQVIHENATAYAQETYGRDDLRSEIERIIADRLAAHRREQSRWELPTDCDRLYEAFASMNRLGIVARQDFSCCNNCGHKDIWDEIVQAEETQLVEGYVFYHFQFTERAIETGQLLLAYGSVFDEDGSLARVANTIVRELRQAGLDARWDGSANSPIVIEGMVWRRRR